MNDINMIIDKINSSNDTQILINFLYGNNTIKTKKYLLYNIDDSIKIDCLLLGIDEIYSKMIISSLHSDLDKIKYIYLLSDYDKFEIISKFISDKDKINSLVFLCDQYWKDLILFSLKDYDLRKKNIINIENDNIKINLLNEFDILTKIKNLNTIKNINARKEFLLKLLNIEDEKLINIEHIDEEYISSFASIYNISENSLKKLINRFSVEVLLYLDTNLKELLKYGEKEFDRFLKIFDESNFDLSKEELNNICFSIEYYRFNINTDSIYKKFLCYLELNDSKKFLDEYNKILEYLNTEEIYKIIKYNELTIDNIKHLSYNLFNKINYLKNLDILRIILNIYIDKKRAEYIKENIDGIEKNINNIVNVNKEDILDIILNINYEEIYDNIIINDSIYNKLIKILYKYKYLSFTDNVYKLFELVNLKYDNNIKKNIIEKFYDYYPYLECNRNEDEFINIVYMVNGYEKDNYDKYLLLGKSNYFKLKNKEYSFDLIKNNIISLFNKKTVCIPSFTYSELNIEASVGVFFNKVNYLEKYDKGEFCILFKDIKMNNIFSKINGFRKGNTLFLKEFDCLLKTDVKKEELVLIMKNIASKIIELSSKEKDNIESIYISVYNYNDVNKDFIYFMNTKYVLLYGSKPTDLRKEFDFDKYNVIRNKILLYEKNSAVKKIYEFNLLNNILNGRNKEIEYDDDVLYIYAGEDWYIKKMRNNELISFTLDVSKDNIKTNSEKNICMEILKYDDKNK